jgi:hypothetical protein
MSKLVVHFSGFGVPTPEHQSIRIINPAVRINKDESICLPLLSTSGNDDSQDCFLILKASIAEVIDQPGLRPSGGRRAMMGNMRRAAWTEGI